MPQREFEAWTAFYRRSGPAGNVNEALQSALDYLQPEPLPDGMTLADYNTMRAFGIDPNKVG